MAVTNSRLQRPLSEAEVRAFELLQLTPGHWGALAPVPLASRDLRPIQQRDFPSFQELRHLLQSNVGTVAEAERFWAGLANQDVERRADGTAWNLLGWHLATDCPRHLREAYLERLGRLANSFHLPGTSLRDIPLRLVAAVRVRLEAYLGVATYHPNPSEPAIDPPDPAEVARLLGPDLWKQTLTAPLAESLNERGMRPSDISPLIRRLARVTDHRPGVPPEALEHHLKPGWLALLDPTTDHIASNLKGAVQIAVRGLASMRPIEDRERILLALAGELARTVNDPDRDRYAARWVDRLREQIEDVIRASRGTMTTISPLSPTETHPSQTLAVVSPPVNAVNPEAAPPVTQPMASTPLASSITLRMIDDFAAISLDEALATAKAVSVKQIREFLTASESKPRLLFDDHRSECSEVAIIRYPACVPPLLWVIGDVHADILALANIVACVEQLSHTQGVPPAFLFLGDFVDRGRHDHETLLFLFGLILRHPGRVCVLAGNHDIDLQWDTKVGRFSVSIEPAEYCERLNGLLGSMDPLDVEQVELAKLLIPFWQSRPKAVILPDGTMYAHGGFPHTDTHEGLREPADLARPACLSDFLWARITERPKKRPNRGNRGHEFGWNDFAEFCKRTDRLGVPPVRRLIRGHDHVAERWQCFPEYTAYPVLTINAMGRRMDGEAPPNNQPHPYPVFARHVPGALPEVMQLPLDAIEVNRAFGHDQQPNPSVVGFPDVPSCG